ncbi:metallophosphoesterase family protein [Paenibacillus sp. NPDC056722]|uniref:metallophosphoesterase family protein n=1 Tax=Paenibacillus sp. NPDC056722 TaxID=3345924 RepID=UPI0036B1E7E6
MKLAIIGDLHYPDELTSDEPSIAAARDAYYERFMDLFLSLEADYYISIGDLTHAGEAAEFKYVMRHIEKRGLRDRFLHVLGNHDTYTHPKSDILALTRLKRYEVIEEHDARIILLDTAREIREDWSGTIDEEQLNWLHNQFRQDPDKPLIVIGHHPLYGTTARSTESMMSLDPDLTVWPLFEQWQGAGFYFNGHNHVNSIVQQEHWHFIQTAAVPDVPSVRMVNIIDQEVNVETISFASDAFSNWASVFTPHMYDYERHPGCEGDTSALELFVNAQTARKGVAPK